MATSVLTTEEIKTIEKAAHDFPELGGTVRQWIPRKKVPHAYATEWFTLNRVTRPQSSKFGRPGMGVRTARTAAEANSVYFRFDITWDFTEVEMARNAGVPIQTEDVRTARRQMEMEISRLVYQGLDDDVYIAGLLDSGEDTDSGLDDDLWDTVGEPIEHANQGTKDLIANHFPPPYIWVLSWNLWGGLAIKHNAAVDLSTREYIAKAYQVAPIYFEQNGTSTDLIVYPLPPATTDDGVWLMLKPAMENFRLEEMTDGIELHIDPKLDQDDMVYRAIMLWHGTLAIVQASSIVFEPDVDLA